MMNRRVGGLLVVMAVILTGLISLSSSYGQDDESVDAPTKVPLIIEVVNGENEQIYAVVYEDAVLKTLSQDLGKATTTLDNLTERIASLEAYLLSSSTPPNPDKGATINTLTIDINTASFDDLLKIPGIARVRAGAIIADRGTPGIPGYRPYEDFVDLARRINGIGGGTVSDMNSEPSIKVIINSASTE